MWPGALYAPRNERAGPKGRRGRRIPTQDAQFAMGLPSSPVGASRYRVSICEAFVI